MPTVRKPVVISPVPTAAGTTTTPTTLTTTLYDLIAAIQDATGVDDDTLVVATTLHILRAGHATRGGQVAA